MGVDLNVWANHKLKFNSFEKGIEEFERLTSRKIKPWNFKTDKPLEKTNKISEIAYFTNFDILKHNFEHWKQIRIWTNFEFCSELTVYGKTIQIHPSSFRIRYSKWQQLVTERYESESVLEIEQLRKSRENWVHFRRYAKEITKTLEGDKVIYLNDHKYQNEEDLFFKGESLEEGILQLSKINEPIELDLFRLYPNDIRAKTTWYFDDLNAKN